MMDFSKFKKLTIGGVELKQLFINGIQVWKAVTYKNWVKFSTEADGVTIYNGGLGYKNGYRIRSGGAEGEATQSVCTGFIPCKAGDVIRVCYQINQPYQNGINAFNVYDASKTHLGQCASNGHYGIFNGTGEWSNVTIVNNLMTYTMPTTITSADKIAFVRVTTSSGEDASGANLIVTINEEIV